MQKYQLRFKNQIFLVFIYENYGFISLYFNQLQAAFCYNKLHQA